MNRWRSVALETVWAGVLVALVTINQPIDGHKIISSRYTYNEHVFPILRDRCGNCHVEGGVAPMSLMTHKEAFPWAEAIRAVLIAGHMPPSEAVDGSHLLRGVTTMTATELDQVLTWASGGTPEGDLARVPTPVRLSAGWRLGTPDLVLQVPTDYTMRAQLSDDVREFRLKTGLAASKRVRSVEIRPGSPAIVRFATVSVAARVDRASALPMERTLALWPGGEAPETTASGTGFELPAGADIVLRIHYKKTFSYESKAVLDRTTIGLHFASSDAADIRTYVVTSPRLTGTEPEEFAFSRVLDEDLTALGFYPDPVLTNARVGIAIISPDGKSTRRSDVSVRADQARRYWFDSPVMLENGSRIEVSLRLSAADGILPPAASATPAQSLLKTSVRVVFDVVRSRAGG